MIVLKLIKLYAHKVSNVIYLADKMQFSSHSANRKRAMSPLNW